MIEAPQPTDRQRKQELIRAAFARAAELEGQDGTEPGSPSKTYREAWAGRLERAGEWGVTQLILGSQDETPEGAT